VVVLRVAQGSAPDRGLLSSSGGRAGVRSLPRTGVEPAAHPERAFAVTLHAAGGGETKRIWGKEGWMAGRQRHYKEGRTISDRGGFAACLAKRMFSPSSESSQGLKEGKCCTPSLYGVEKATW